MSLVGSPALDWTDRSVCRQPSFALPSSSFLGLDFDSTLGYPGEGLVFVLCFACCVLFVCWPWTSVAPFAMVNCAGAVLLPRNVADLAIDRERGARSPHCREDVLC